MPKSDVRKEQGARLADFRKAVGYKSAREAALDNNWPESTYRAHESGGRTIGFDDAERYARRFRSLGAKVNAQQILFGLFGEASDAAVSEERDIAADRTTIPIMGYIGAGAEIDPDYEQVPVDGLDQVQVPIALPDDVLGLQVRGDSMLPKYPDGWIIVVHREQVQSTASLIGEEVAVRTYDGRRFLKILMPGTKPHTYNLESFNARPIAGARIAWASKIVVIIPSHQVKRSQLRTAKGRGSTASTSSRKGTGR